MGGTNMQSPLEQPTGFHQADLDLLPLRRPLDVDDYLDILRRRKLWIIIPVYVALVASVAVAFLWKDTYVSEAVIRVVPPQVAEQVVPPNINLQLSERIQSMAEKILSRTNLLNIMQTYNLYPEERQKMTDDDVVEQKFRPSIRISEVQTIRGRSSSRQPISAFSISFAYHDRFLAQRVTQELARRFIDENIREREARSVQTTDFLAYQVEQAKKELEAIENKLAEFRRAHQGTLPDQLDATVQQLRSAEAQMNAINMAMSRITQEKLLLEGELRTLQMQLEELGRAPEDLKRSLYAERLSQLEQQIVNLETQIAAMLQHYRETHPDVESARKQLELLKKKRDELIGQQAKAASSQESEQQVTKKVLTPAEERMAAQIRAQIERIKNQIAAKDMELEERRKEQERVNQLIERLQARIQAIPASQAQYDQLLQELKLARAKYEDLRLKMEQSELATSLERRKQAERLELLDQASLPLEPAEPDRLMIIGIGFGFGLILGLGLAVLVELKDTSLKNLKDVRSYTGLPVLAAVPEVEPEAIKLRRRRLAVVGWTLGVLAGVAVMGASVLYYYTTVRAS